MFDWVAVSLLGLAFICLVIAGVAFWFESLEGITLALLWSSIFFGGMFIFGGVWSIFANGGPHITRAVILIGCGLFIIVRMMVRLYDD